MRGPYILLFPGNFVTALFLPSSVFTEKVIRNEFTPKAAELLADSQVSLPLEVESEWPSSTPGTWLRIFSSATGTETVSCQDKLESLLKWCKGYVAVWRQLNRTKDAPEVYCAYASSSGSALTPL